MKTTIEDPVRELERRLLIIGAWLVSGGSLATWAIWGFGPGLSFVAGGVLGGVSLTWLRRGLGTLFARDQKTTKRMVLAGFLLRVLLIPLCLYAMIRFLFLSVPAAVAGFAVLHFSVLVEGILEAFSNSSKTHARTK